MLEKVLVLSHCWGVAWNKALLSETGPENGQGQDLSCHQFIQRRKDILMGQQEAPRPWV